MMRRFATLAAAAALMVSLAPSAFGAIVCPEKTKSISTKNEKGSTEQCVSVEGEKPEGPRVDYDNRGAKRREWSYHEGVTHGQFAVFSSDGKKLREGGFKMGRLDGKSRRWYANGQLEDETEWADGRPQGDSKSFFENGKQHQDGQYKSGRRVGNWKTWKDDGTLVDEKNFGGVRRSFPSGWRSKVFVSGPAQATAAWPGDAEVEVQEFREGEFQYVARLQTRFREKDWQLVSGSDWYPAWDPEETTSTFNATLTSDKTHVDAYGLGPNGTVERYRIELQAEDLTKRELTLKANPPRRYYLLAAAGVTSISYTEGATITASQLALGVKVSYRNTILPPRIDMALSGYYSGLPLTQSGSPAAKFLGLNARIGYIVPGMPDSWSLSLMGGAYYTTMFVSNSTYGYTHLFGPQLFPYLTRRIGAGDMAFAYLKYSPICDNLKFLSLTEREMAIGGGYVRTLDSGARVGVLFDYSRLNLDHSNIHILNSTIGASVAYGL